MTKKTKTPKVLLGKGGVSSAGWHKIESFLRCPKAYQFGQVRGIHKPAACTPEHFAVGILFHAMRARWFATKFQDITKCWDKILDACREAKEACELPVTLESEQKALDLIQQYMKHWLLQPRPTPVAAEYLLGPAPLRATDSWFNYRTARLDDLSRYPEAGGELCIGESKTTSTSVGDTVTQYTLHGQPLMQMALYKMCPNGEAKYGPIAGVMLDVTVKGYEGKPAKFGRAFVPVKQDVVAWYVESMMGYLKAAEMVGWDTPVPRNTHGCTYQAGRMRVVCEYRDLCMYGKEASGQYVLRGGKSLRDTSAWNGEVPPWE
jgi:hypothetical protein